MSISVWSYSQPVYYWNNKIYQFKVTNGDKQCSLSEYQHRELSYAKINRFATTHMTREKKMGRFQKKTGTSSANLHCNAHPRKHYFCLKKIQFGANNALLDRIFPTGAPFAFGTPLNTSQVKCGLHSQNQLELRYHKNIDPANLKW